MTFNYYCLTIRKCSGVKTHKQALRVLNYYEHIINNIKMNETTHVEYHFEVEGLLRERKNVHIHAMIKAKQTPTIKRTKGFSVCLEKCRSQQAWNVYITKRPWSKQMILDLFQIPISPLETEPKVELKKSDEDIRDLPNYVDEDLIEGAPNYQEHIRK